MSWLQDGLNRLLHPGSSNREAAQQKPASAVTSPTQDRPKSLFGLLQKHSSPPLEQQGVQHTGQGAAGTSQHSSKQHQLLDGPGSAYANLPCLKQLKPIRSAAGDLSAAVLTALPGVKLDSSWVVYQTAVKEPAGLQVNSQAGLSYVCILPALQPPGYFCSQAAVISFLRQLQDAGVSMPGVLNQPKAPSSPAAAQRHAAAVTAALQSCGPMFRFIDAADSVRDSTGSGDTDAAAAPAAAPAAAAAENNSFLVQLKQVLPHIKKRSLEQREHPQQQADQAWLNGSEQPQKQGRYSPAESSLDRKSSGASTPPLSPNSFMRASPGAAAAAAAAAAGACAAVAGRKKSPTGSDILTISGAVQKAPPSVHRPGAAAAELERLRKQQEAAQKLMPEAAALLQSDEDAVELLATLGGDQEDGLDDIIMVDVPLLDALGAHAAAAARRPAAVAAAAAGSTGAAAGTAATDAAAAAAAGGTGLCGRLKPGRLRLPRAGSESPDSSELMGPDWEVLQRLQSLRSSEPQPTPTPSSAGPAPSVRLNRVDAKLESIRRAALVLGREPSMSAEMAAPRPGAVKYAKTPGSAGAGAAAAGKAGLPPRPKPRLDGGSGGRKKEKVPALPATNTFTAASDVKAMSKLDSLLRAKDAAAAIKAAVQSGLPYEGTLEQRHHAMRQSLKNQLADGRVPSAEGLAVLQANLSGQLPGARLDSEWLVYPATPQDSIPKLDILIRHPKVTQGYFRSYKSVVNFYVALTDLLKSSKGSNGYYSAKELAVPGLSIVPDSLQKASSNTGRSPGEMFTLMTKALGMVGRSFVKDGAGTAAAAAAAGDGRRPSSPAGDSEGGLYPAGGTKAAVANAAAVAARQWQPPPLVANLEPPRKGSSVLVLGMFYASEATAFESHNGLAQYRDRIRLAALHKQVGYIPLSYDRDHEVELAELAPDEQGKQVRLHVQGNFNSKRGAAAVADRFPDTRFTAVFCDYFRMPSGYAGDIYKAQLFTDYIPELVRRGNLPAGVPIYIPNSPVLLEQLAASGAFRDYGDVVAVPARCYPLYEATRHAEVAGLMPAKYSNAGQVRELVPGAEFIVVHYCGDATPSPVGP